MKLNPDEWPEFNFLQLPVEVDFMREGADGDCLLIFPRAEIALSTMTPRDRWKLQHQEARLKRRGIVIARTVGVVGHVLGVKVTP